MIILKDVEKSFGETRVLRGINLEVERGEFISITGSSGSGKSTLLNLIGGMDRPEKGRVVVGGKDITSYSDDELTLYRRKEVGFVFQFFNLLPNISVFENVEMPLLLNGVDDPERVRGYLMRVGLQRKERSLPYELSGGEQQRVAIARALVHDPQLILADEPTGSLDSKTGVSIMDMIKELAAGENKTVVLVTHEEHVSAYAERRVRIKDGLIVP